MHKLLAVLLVGVCVPACGGGPDPEQERATERRFKDLELSFEKKIVELERRYADVQNMAQNTKGLHRDITALKDDWLKIKKESDEKLDVVRKILSDSLTSQVRALKEQLSTVEGMLEKLKK